jgi:hypothetical protein
VDIPSNVITQNVLSVLDVLDALAVHDVLPPSFLPVFLHELTHHWCFNTSVGSALALLRQRALRLIGGPVDVPKVQHLLYESVLRYLVALRALMPLIEGLALFSEFDAIPGDCRSISIPAKWGGKFFVRMSEREPHTVEGLRQAWQEVTRQHRTSLEGIGRKLLLLTAPLEGLGRGNYLRGYLGLRAVHRTALKQSRQFDDGDFFVTYVRHLFFNDHYLAALLLASEPKEGDWVAAFLQRLNQRIACFAKHELKTQAVAFDNLIASERGDLESLEPEIFVEHGSLRRFRQEYDKLMDDPADGLLDTASLSAWRWQAPLLMRHRCLVRLAHSMGRVRVDQNLDVWFKDRRIGPALPQAVIGEGEGTAVIYFLPDSDALLLVAVLAGQLVRVGGPALLAAGPEFHIHIAAIRNVLAQEEVDCLVADGVASLEGILGWFTGMPDQLAKIEQTAELAWINLTLREVEPSKREACRKAMARAGFGQLLRCDQRLVDGLATISAFSAARLTCSELRAHLASRNINVDAIINDLRLAEVQTGFPFFGQEGTCADGAHHVTCLV